MMLVIGRGGQATAYAIALLIAQRFGGVEGMFAQAISLGLLWGALIDLVEAVMNGTYRR